MKNQSLFFKFALSILGFYSVYTILFYFFDINADLKNYKIRRTSDLVLYSQVSRDLLRADQDQDLLKHLKNAKEKFVIDLYSLNVEGKIIGEDGVIASTRENFNLLGVNSISYYPNAALSRLEVGHKQLILGTQYGLQDRINRLWVENRLRLLQDIGFVFVALLALATYAFRDFFKIFNTLKRNDKNTIKKMRGSSKEGEVLIRALGGYESELNVSREKNQMLTQQLLPALRREIETGLEPPYEFECTMARTDINSFSTIFLHHPRDAFMELIGDFFWESAHIISRYNGLIHSFAGDEIIYYFKQDDKTESAKLAIAAIRDIHLLAETFSKNSTTQNGYAFVVKSSLAKGTLRFGKLVDSMALAGTPFIETVRILSAIQEKEKNTLYLNGELLALVENPFIFQKVGLATLKGYSKEVELFSYLDRHHISGVLEKARNHEVKNLFYFRSDQDICATLADLTDASGWEQATYLGVIAVLRTFTCTKVNSDLQLAYTKLLQKEMSLVDTHRLPAVLSLATNLIPKTALSADLEEIFLRALALKDRRIVANAIELFTFYCPDRHLEEIKPFLANKDNRVSANAIIKAAFVSLDEDLIQRLALGLHSNNPLPIASTLFALGEIAQFYRLKDPVFLNTRLSLSALLQKIPALAGNENAMISRQAIGAAKKLSDAGIDAQLRLIFEKSQNPELDQRFFQVYGWHKSANRAA